MSLSTDKSRFLYVIIHFELPISFAYVQFWVVFGLTHLLNKISSIRLNLLPSNSSNWYQNSELNEWMFLPLLQPKATDLIPQSALSIPLYDLGSW